MAMLISLPEPDEDEADVEAAVVEEAAVVAAEEPEAVVAAVVEPESPEEPQPAIVPAHAAASPAAKTVLKSLFFLEAFNFPDLIILHSPLCSVIWFSRVLLCSLFAGPGY